MHISLTNDTSRLFTGNKPAFLQPKQHALYSQQNATQKLADLLNGKSDKASISDEAKRLLAKLDEPAAETPDKDPKQQVQAFLGLAKQSLHDLAKDLDTQLKNVDVLESAHATAEEKLAARDNIARIEAVADLRGGLFSDQLLDKVVPNASQAVQAASTANDPLLTTNAKSLGLESIADASPASMRDLLIAAKERVLQKAAAIESVSTTFSTYSTKPRPEQEQLEMDLQQLLQQLNERAKNRIF